MYSSFIKPVFDRFVALISIIVLSPVLFATFFALIVANQGSPFFFQKRPGKHGKLFFILKFKTMNDACDGFGNLLEDKHRITKVGGLVRKLSLDELPQLINVLKGELSLVGPRPLLQEYLPLYNKEQNRRHDVLPGITGWAQVNGRNAISWERKFELDVEYVQKQSFRLDVKILFLTIKKVFVREGISAVGEATICKFTGSMQ